MQSKFQSAKPAIKSITQRAHRPDYQIILYTGMLMLLGLVVMYAIGPQRARVLNSGLGVDAYNDTYFVVKQFTSLSVALAAMIALAVTPLSIVKKYSGKILIAGLVASGFLFIFGNLFNVSAVTTCTLGACRWLNLGPLGSFQPAELLKFGLLVFLARFMAEQIRLGKLNDWQQSIQPILIVCGVVLGVVVVLQRDMGTGISLAAIVISMMIAAGIDKKLGAKLLAGMAVLAVLAIVTAPHRIERVMTFFQGDDHKSEKSLDENYQVRHAKIAIGSGGLTGVGIGNSVEATGYLPEAVNDSLFAILGETFGFVGLTVIITILTALLLRILRISDRVIDTWMKLVVAGVFGWLSAHVILNIASMIGIFPLTGITLPLLSFGGTSMLFIAMAIGMVFQISRFTSHEKILKETAHANFSRGRGIGRTRHTDRTRSR